MSKILEKVYLTNNIYESIHSHISNYIENKKVSKTLFKETLNFILNHYKYNLKKCVRGDFITRTLIIIVEKYELNDSPKFISYEIFLKELEYTISLMTGNEKIKMVEEIINTIDYFENIKDEVNIDKDISINEEDSNSISFKSEDNNNEEFSFDIIDFYEELSDNFNFDFIDDENQFDDEEILNLSINSYFSKQEDDFNDKYFNITDIEKDRGHLSLFTFNINNISQKLKKLLLSNDKKNPPCESDYNNVCDNIKNNKNKKIFYLKN